MTNFLSDGKQNETRYEIFEQDDGTIRHTGLLVPQERPKSFQLYADQRLVLTRDQCARIVTAVTHRMGRNRFGASWIFNQGSIGQCACSAAARMMMRQRALRGQEDVELSSEFIYANVNGGRDGGSMLDDGMRWIMDNGTCEQSMVPWQEYRKRNLRPETYGAAKRFRALECYRAHSDDELASGIALGFTGVVAVQANNQWSRLDSDGVAGASDGPGNHSVGIDDVRIKDGEYQYDSPNSWGTGWGTFGRAWLTWQRHFRTSSQRQTFYLLRGMTDDPEETNPPLPRE